MSPKWAKKAHFGDISYNVFNRRKSSYLIQKPLNVSISCRMDPFTESIYQKLIFSFYFFNIQKDRFASFWCYRVYCQNYAHQPHTTFAKIIEYM